LVFDFSTKMRPTPVNSSQVVVESFSAQRSVKKRRDNDDDDFESSSCRDESDKNKNKVADFLLQAAQLGHAEAQWKLTADALAHDDHKTAFHWCQQAANQSHPLALARMGRYHLEGVNGTTTNNQHQTAAVVSRDLNMAFNYYKRAAEQQHRGALSQLAQMYERGIGCNVDFREAARCYITLAREFSCPESMFCLGNLYMMGDGVRMDSDKAFQLWERAAKLGHEGAQSFLTLRDLASD
jgi:TPR repeat protein